MKKILTDVDGVLLNWRKQFFTWMDNEGYTVVRPKSHSIARTFDLDRVTELEQVKDFNESVWISHLEALDNAVDGVKKLTKAGYTIDVCSAIVVKILNCEAVVTNKVAKFPSFTHMKPYYVGLDKPKTSFFEEYRDSGCYWVEDLPKNALAGLEYGLRPLLVSESYKKFEHPEIKVSTGDSNLNPFYIYTKEDVTKDNVLTWDSFKLSNMETYFSSFTASSKRYEKINYCK